MSRPAIDHLKQLLMGLSMEPLPKAYGEDREVIGWGPDGAVYADDYTERRRDSALRMVLQQIADAQGDVDSFIAQHSEMAKTTPMVAAEIAQRRHAANRTHEAWQAINGIDQDRPGRIPFEWERTRLARPRLSQAHQQQLIFAKLSVMFRSSLDTSIKPILCPSKPGPTLVESLRQAGLPE